MEHLCVKDKSVQTDVEKISLSKPVKLKQVCRTRSKFLITCNKNIVNSRFPHI